MSDSGWYYDDRGERRGPVHFSILRRMGEIGTIHGGTQVWNEKLDGWEPASRHIPGIAPPPLNMSQAGSGRVGGLRDYHERVGMGAAVSRAFSGYFDFSGRANRGEYWWFVLANILIGLATGFLDGVLGLTQDAGTGVINGIWSLVVLIPSLALTARRLHDTGRSGWYQLMPWSALLLIIPMIVLDTGVGAGVGGVLYLVLAIVLLVWLCQRGDSQPNRFG
jgi:uncharacterized membrane protein YhaH (DUF805 family)